MSMPFLILGSLSRKDEVLLEISYVPGAFLGRQEAEYCKKGLRRVLFCFVLKESFCCATWHIQEIRLVHVGTHITLSS